METTTATQSQTFEQAVEKVVNWWAEQSFDGGLNQNNGDNTKQGEFGFLLMNTLSLRGQAEATPEKIQLFKDHLTAELLTTNDRWVKHCLSVDYNADKALLEACNHAGLSTSCLPIKTCTWIDIHSGTNTVTVSLGYQGSREVI